MSVCAPRAERGFVVTPAPGSVHVATVGDRALARVIDALIYLTVFAVLWAPAGMVADLGEHTTSKVWGDWPELPRLRALAEIRRNERDVIPTAPDRRPRRDQPAPAAIPDPGIANPAGRRGAGTGLGTWRNAAAGLSARQHRANAAQVLVRHRRGTRRDRVAGRGRHVRPSGGSAHRQRPEQRAHVR